MAPTLVFTDPVAGTTGVVRVARLLVAGFTGRDEQAVAHHISELADLGVPVPDSTPTLYPLEPDLVRQTPALVVEGPNTSGEVEPVIVVSGGELMLTIGSDHTDRDVERTDIAASKAACIKVVGSTWVPLSAIHDWDGIEISSSIGEGEAYQRGTLAALLPLEALLAHLRDGEGLVLGEGDVLFLGTVPVEGGIRPSDRFQATLRIPGRADPATLDYRVVDTSSARRPRLDKPELEFFPVEDVDWTPVDPPVPGLTERILARDPGSGTASRMLRFEPGTDTSAIGVLRHDFWEEVYILSGDLHDHTLGETFRAGTYACRPPGMPHGPWVSTEGCVTFEVRYPPM